MDKIFKNAAICIKINNEKEDRYFISQKINKIRECCNNDIVIKDIFTFYGVNKINFTNSQRDRIKEKQIQVLFVEDNENIEPIDNVEIKKVNLTL